MYIFLRLGDTPFNNKDDICLFRFTSLVRHKSEMFPDRLRNIRFPNKIHRSSRTRTQQIAEFARLKNRSGGYLDSLPCQ